MSGRDWERREFERLDLKLNHDTPMLLWHHSFARRRQLSFDMHYACEIGIVCRGAMLRTYRDHERLVRPGGVWLCGLWEPHGGRVTQAPCESLAFAVLPEMLALSRYPEASQINWTAPFMAPPERRPRVGARAAKEVLSLVRYFKRGIREHGGSPPPLLLRFALMEVLRILLQDWQTSGTETSAQAGRQINRAVQLVFSRKGPLTATEAAKACEMSRSHFDRVFPNIMGLSFPAFALRHRLHGVAEQLLATRDPLKTIAGEWGFADASHLLRRFVELFGCTPKEYRNTERGGRTV